MQRDNSMKHETEVLLHAVREAGAAVQALQTSQLNITTKANHDIVTQGDLLANDILKAHLNKAFPAIAWLSEESVDDLSRLSCERVWIVDPIDGTREFASGIPEYAISVALIENSEPVLSAVFNPVTNELFHAIKNQGAWLGDEKLQCCSHEYDMLLLASRSEYGRGEWDVFQQYHQVKQVGSIAYKLALIAAGKAHATFSLRSKNEWDIAAGVLLVTEAGGNVTNQSREKIIFNQQNTRVNGVVASSHLVNETIFNLINRVR